MSDEDYEVSRGFVRRRFDVIADLMSDNVVFNVLDIVERFNKVVNGVDAEVFIYLKSLIEYFRSFRRLRACRDEIRYHEMIFECL